MKIHYFIEEKETKRASKPHQSRKKLKNTDRTKPKKN